MTHSIWLWVAFIVFILAMLGLDLGVFHRKSRIITVKKIDRVEPLLDNPRPYLQRGDLYLDGP